MALTHAQDQTVKRYKRIAEAIRKTVEGLHVKSSNKFWNLQKKQTGIDLDAQRDTGYTDDQDCANIISNSRVGNCMEKGKAYAVWCSQHAQFVAGTDRVYTVSFNPHWDHVVAVMCETAHTVGTVYRLTDFGTTLVVLDGWSEDFYFPNIGKLDAIRLNVWRAQNPFQMWVRGKVHKLGRAGKNDGAQRMIIRTIVN